MNIHIHVLTIGALAKATGVTTPTVRYYEEIGLLPVAARSASGQRVYDDDDIVVVRGGDLDPEALRSDAERYH